jgi:RHS repeat-associated protein
VYDAETGLHYNYHRYYDPKTGRYTQSDPIGLAGGVNTYGYVGGNPVGLSDPFGLFGQAVEGGFSCLGCQ